MAIVRRTICLTQRDGVALHESLGSFVETGQSTRNRREVVITRLAAEYLAIRCTLGVLCGEALVILLIDESWWIDVVTVVDAGFGAGAHELDRTMEYRFNR
jgi:intracellular sulfur oxidation DsrE/DsrF family protein